MMRKQRIIMKRPSRFITQFATYLIIFLILLIYSPQHVLAEDTEILDGKYTISTKIKLTDGIAYGYNYSQPDVDSEIISATVRNGTNNEWSVFVHVIENETSILKLTDEWQTIDNTKTNANRVAFSNRTDVRFQVTVFNITDWSNTFIISENNKTLSSIYGVIAVYRKQNTVYGNDSIIMHYLNNDTKYVVAEDDGSGLEFFYYNSSLSIHDEYIVYYAHPDDDDPLESFAEYYNYIEGTYGNFSHNDFVSGTISVDTAEYGEAKVWENELVFTVTYESGDLPDGYNMDIFHYNISADIFTNLTTVDITDHEIENPDMSRNIVVWTDTRNGSNDIYGYDLEEEEEFIIDDNDTYESSDSAIWIDDDDNGIVVYTANIGGISDIYYRYINFTEPETPEEPESEPLTITQLTTGIMISIFPFILIVCILGSVINDKCPFEKEKGGS